MTATPCLQADLTVIGAGMAGLSAAFFASRRGCSTAVVGSSSELAYASGLFDLLGVHPSCDGSSWLDPWEGIDVLVRDEPRHPYARLARTDLRSAVGELLGGLADAGLSYWNDDDRNSDVVTPLGTLKRTYALPRTMKAGVLACRDSAPCVVVGFDGLKDFNAHHVAAALQSCWPGLRGVRIPFPGLEQVAEVAVEVLARSLEIPSIRARLLERLSPLVQGQRALGLPAMLGVGRSIEVHAALESDLGVPVFEIPTTPISVPGLRLKLAFAQLLRGQGARLLTGKRVLSASHTSRAGFELQVGSTTTELIVRSPAVVLASGRFFGGGLCAERTGVLETVFGLPVWQPADRSGWHRDAFLDPRGHPISQAGIQVDPQLRPCDATGLLVNPSLFAAGSILAHQDWIRTRCGSGLAVGTAYAAVRSFLRLSKGDA